MTIPAKMPNASSIEEVLIKGDLTPLTPEQRVKYYKDTCDSLGLNWLTKPFDYIVLNGKLQLYALRAATDQLRKIHGVTVEVISRDIADGILTIHVRARMPDGRADEDFGAVSFPETLKGDNRANAELKCVTKAKRRATLSICGLGWLDENEVLDIPASANKPAPPAANVMLPAQQTNDQREWRYDTTTGEIIENQSGTPGANPDPEPAPPPSEQSRSDNLNEMAEEVPAETESERLTRLVKELKAAAEGGLRPLAAKWKTISASDQHVLEGTKEDLKEKLKKMAT